MAVTQAEIDELERVINSGVERTRYGDKEVTYRGDLAALRLRLAEMKRELAGTTATPCTTLGYVARD